MFLESMAVSYRSENRTICQNLDAPDWPEVQQILSSGNPFVLLSLQDQTRQLVVRRQPNESYEIVALQMPTLETACLDSGASLATVLRAIKTFVFGGRFGL